jgi:hypothetical protein
MKGLFCFWVAQFKLLVSFQVMKNSTQPFAQIKIPEPCQEDWTGMVLKEDGRFCKNCSKSVIDFSRFTDQQLQNYFETHRNSSICGRIPVSKLNTSFEIPKHKKSFSGWWLLPALAGISLPTFAQTSQQSVEQTDPKLVDSAISIENRDTNFMRLKGIVTDANTAESIPFAAVQLLPLKVAANTNFNGEFELIIPDSLNRQANYELVITYVGFETLRKQFTSEELISISSSPLKLELKLAQAIIIGMVIYERPPWHKRLKYRIKQMFKRQKHEGSSSEN